MYKSVTVNLDVDVDVSLEDFDIEDIIEFLEDDGYTVSNDLNMNQIREIVDTIFQKQRTKQNFDQELSSLIYLVTGRITD